MRKTTNRNLRLGGLLAAALSTSACIFPSDTIDEPCPAIAVAPARNPATGACEIRDGWSCDEFGQTNEPELLGEPWASCYTGCEQLEGVACQEAVGCQQAYFDADGGYDYLGEEPLACWAVIQDFAVAGDCQGLDAWSCATRDDCRPVYWPADVAMPEMPPESGMAFSYCAPEITPDGPGLCYPPTDGYFCTALPPECPTGTAPGAGAGCWTGYCIPLEDCEPAPACEGLGENSCLARSDCDALYVACEPNEDCEYDFYGCITK